MNREQPSPPRQGGRAANLTDAVTDRFHEAIATGRWPVGTRIPVESELMAEVGAGRNTVREAIQSLVQAGLVRREQGRGTFVIARSALVSSLARRTSHAERRDGLEVRGVLDSAAAAIAARRREDSDVAALRSALLERTRSWQQHDRSLRVATDLALHRAVVVATGNELLVELYDGLVPLYEEVLATDVDHETDPHAAQHEELVRAIVEQRPEDASAAVRSILEPLIDSEARRA